MESTTKNWYTWLHLFLLYIFRSASSSKNRSVEKTSTVPEQELRSSCLISWIGDHPRDSDYPRDGDHPRMVIKVWPTSSNDENTRNWDYNWNGNRYEIWKVLGMVTVLGMVIVQGMGNIIAMVGVDNRTPYIYSNIIWSSYLKFGTNRQTNKQTDRQYRL